MILELKVANSIEEMEKRCREALRQIETQEYEQILRADSYETILKYGICFFKKGCMVRKAPYYN